MTVPPRLKDEEVIRMYLLTQQSNYFGTLYDRYVHKVYRRCLSLTNDTARAEDFTHDIFLRVYGSLPYFKEHSSFSTWLYAISYNYCMDQIRAASRLTTVPLEPNQDYDLAESDEGASKEAQMHRLTKAIKTLAPDDVRMLWLKYRDDHDIREIARQFDLKESAVKMRLKRIRDKIRRQYDK